MNKQISVIREALLLRDMESCEEALTALSEIEAMVGEQQPVGEVQHLHELNDAWLAALPIGTKLYTAAPVAQQRKTVTNDEQASAYLDARLWEFIDMAGMWPRAKPDPRIWAHVMVYAPVAQQPTFDARRALEAIEALLSNIRRDAPSLSGKVMGFAEEVAAALRDKVAKQPQAEPTDSMGIPLSCGKPLCSPGDHHPLCKLHKKPQAESDAYCITTPDGGCISTDPRCMHQPQAEAVPPGYVLAPVNPTPEIMRALGNKWDGANAATWQRVIAAIAQQKGQP